MDWVARLVLWVAGFRHRRGTVSDRDTVQFGAADAEIFGENRSTRVIPNLIQHHPRSEELVCLHEAGHVERILSVGGLPVLVEIYDDPEPSGRSRAPKFAGLIRQEVAVAGYAVELQLFMDRRLVDARSAPITEKEFIRRAVADHAAEDKISFFGENREQANKCWPAEDDRTFMQAGEHLRTRLDLELIADLATELLNRRRLEAPEIQAIVDRHRC